MSDAYMRCTSICHCSNSNYQIDQAGSRHDCIARFESECLGRQVIWAKLFAEKDGTLVAVYDSVVGLTTQVR